MIGELGDPSTSLGMTALAAGQHTVEAFARKHYILWAEMKLQVSRDADDVGCNVGEIRAKD